jgi:hypothetical protein
MLPIYLENLTSQRFHPQGRHVWTLYRRFSTSKWTRSMKASRWLSISKIPTLRSYHNQPSQSWVSSILHGTMSHMRLMCSQELTATCYSLSRRSMSTAAILTNCSEHWLKLAVWLVSSNFSPTSCIGITECSFRTNTKPSKNQSRRRSMRLKAPETHLCYRLPSSKLSSFRRFSPLRS